MNRNRNRRRASGKRLTRSFRHPHHDCLVSRSSDVPVNWIFFLLAKQIDRSELQSEVICSTSSSHLSNVGIDFSPKNTQRYKTERERDISMQRRLSSINEKEYATIFHQYNRTNSRPSVRRISALRSSISIAVTTIISGVPQATCCSLQ